MRRRREPEPPTPPARLQTFRLIDWLPDDRHGAAFEDVAVAAIRRWQAARDSWPRP